MTMMNSTSTLFLNSSSRGPPPWFQFSVCSVAPYGFIFYFGVKVFNLLVGTPCNVLVLWQIASRKSDACTSDIFIFNLAVMDAFFCLVTPIEMVNRLLLDDQRIWYFQRFAYGIKDVAPLYLVCICMDRYMAVVHPILFTGNRDNKIRFGISAVVWGLILAYALTKSILGVMSVNELFSGLILFSFALMVFCNLSVIWALRRCVSGKEEMHPVKRKAFKMVLIILAIIVTNYLPPVALMPFVSYYSFVAFRCQISISVFSIMDLSCSIEPLLYITKMDRGDARCCGRCLHRRKKEEDGKV
ncbi:G-protein coupled receptor 35-like [Pseudochaenichthys georgianus]|uniref:G-protein coupled receptor 35-like n=1 Tax=Pseudochaenichthys georgianus TaxID=52239 RepID=UPI00146A7047|nr:G-protein coupled receptor 35-like [Pseudochaenichthys georgianus]